MVGFAQHFQNSPRDFPLPLDRLIGVGICPHRDHLALVAGSGQFLRQQFMRVRFHEQLAFEIETGRKPLIGMGRTRKAVNAAVLAASIGIDRAVETDVGGVVARDDFPRLLLGHHRLERGQFFQALPAVVEHDLGLRLKAAGRIGLGATAPAALGIDRGIQDSVASFFLEAVVFVGGFVQSLVHEMTLTGK